MSISLLESIGLTGVVMIGVLAGILVGSRVLGSRLPLGIVVSISLFTGITAFALFETPAGSAWAPVWLVTMVAGLTLIAVSIRIARVARPVARQRTVVIALLNALPLAALLSAVAAIIVLHQAIEWLVIPVTFFAVSIAGQLWLFSSANETGSPGSAR